MGNLEGGMDSRLFSRAHCSGLEVEEKFGQMPNESDSIIDFGVDFSKQNLDQNKRDSDGEVVK